MMNKIKGRLNKKKCKHDRIFCLARITQNVKKSGKQKGRSRQKKEEKQSDK